MVPISMIMIEERAKVIIQDPRNIPYFFQVCDSSFNYHESFLCEGKSFWLSKVFPLSPFISWHVYKAICILGKLNNFSLNFQQMLHINRHEKKPSNASSVQGYIFQLWKFFNFILNWFKYAVGMLGTVNWNYILI